ncbi:hypothetical protein [Williamsia sterculiae]|uniref:Uncharacterized protein n=1 Tax=Williamsia sterculiae TaxID=1344003 RepID=A0A1N7EZC5_9NOCA|nr:hypothetical protein [Williamsia sterculiae]SIR93439.1 hypothetical protein SAMN05445060_1669 [Williamsia sterculiae]
MSWSQWFQIPPATGGLGVDRISAVQMSVAASLHPEAPPTWMVQNAVADEGPRGDAVTYR